MTLQGLPPFKLNYSDFPLSVNWNAFCLLFSRRLFSPLLLAVRWTTITLLTEQCVHTFTEGSESSPWRTAEAFIFLILSILCHRDLLHWHLRDFATQTRLIYHSKRLFCRPFLRRWRILFEYYMVLLLQSLPHYRVHNQDQSLSQIFISRTTLHSILNSITKPMTCSRFDPSLVILVWFPSKSKPLGSFGLNV